MTSPWYTDWQSAEHARTFDIGPVLDDRNLVRGYEAYNDVRMLVERLDRGSDADLLEIGCATGDFYRYLRLQFPRVRYYGLDISEPAVARARNKFPQGKFGLTEPGLAVLVAAERLGLTRRPAVVYARDVVHHQTKPLTLVSELLEAAEEMLILRGRTRDVGATEADPEKSCQYHYDGWMPYIVSNLDELIDHIRAAAPRAEIGVSRHHMVLGGQQNRYLPRDCYLEETGTAETAVGVFLATGAPGRVHVADLVDRNPRFTADFVAGQLFARGRRYLSRLLTRGRRG